MHGYKNFSQDVKFNLDDFIKKYDFKIVKEADTNVVIENPFVGISFFLEHMVLDSFIYEVKSKEKIFFWGVLIEIFNPSYVSIWMENQNCEEQNRDCVIKRLINYRGLIDTNFSSIIRGDLTWINLYLKKENEGEKLMETIYNLNSNHPIKKKYLQEDPSWLVDLKDLLKREGEL